VTTPQSKRERAARIRETAAVAIDSVSRLLIEVAEDLEAKAEAQEAEQTE